MYNRTGLLMVRCCRCASFYVVSVCLLVSVFFVRRLFLRELIRTHYGVVVVDDWGLGAAKQFIESVFGN